MVLPEEFQLQLQNHFEVRSEGEEDVEETVSKITNALQESALDTAGRHREQKNEKLKMKTKHMLKRMRENWNTTYKYGVCRSMQDRQEAIER